MVQSCVPLKVSQINAGAHFNQLICSLDVTNNGGKHQRSSLLQRSSSINIDSVICQNADNLEIPVCARESGQVNTIFTLIIETFFGVKRVLCLVLDAFSNCLYISFRAGIEVLDFFPFKFGHVLLPDAVQ